MYVLRGDVVATQHGAIAGGLVCSHRTILYISERDETSAKALCIFGADDEVFRTRVGDLMHGVVDCIGTGWVRGIGRVGQAIRRMRVEEHVGCIGTHECEA